MRKTTKQIEKRIAEAIESDERMASKLSAGASFVESFERGLNDYCDSLIVEVNRFREHLIGELNQLKPILLKAASELRGDEIEDEKQIDITPNQLNIESLQERKGKKVS